MLGLHDLGAYFAASSVASLYDCGIADEFNED